MASCTALGPDHVFSIGLQLGLGCATTAKYTLPVPPATCVSTVTSYNPLATSATQQLDVIAPSIATSTFSSGTMLYTYNINNYAQTLAFPATTSVAANPASTTTVTATLSGQGLPYTLTYASGFHWNQQTIAAWQTSGTQCQVVATAAGTANLVSTGTTTTTVANGAVVTNVVMVGASEVDASVGVTLGGTPQVLTSKSYIPVDLQFPTSASMAFTTVSNVDTTISCTVISESFTATGLFDAAHPEHGQGTLNFVVQCNLPSTSSYQVTGLVATGIQFLSALRGDWEDDDHLDSAPNGHTTGAFGSSLTGTNIQQSNGVSQWSFSYGGTHAALCGTTYRFPVAVSACNWDGVCDDANFVDFNLLVMAVGTPSCGYSFQVAAPNIGLSINDGSDPLAANDEWIFVVYYSGLVPTQTFALTGLLADYTTDGGITYSSPVTIPVDTNHCFGTVVAGSLDAVAGNVKDVSSAMTFGSSTHDSVNYFSLIAYVIGSAPANMKACEFILPNFKAKYRLRMTISLNKPPGLKRRAASNDTSAATSTQMSTSFEVNTLPLHGAGLSAAAIEGVVAGCIAAAAIVCAVVVFYAIRKKNLKRLEGTSVDGVDRKCMEAVPTSDAFVAA